MAATSKVREELSKQFLDALSKEQIPWEACWQQQRPLNAATGKPYRGVNAFMLSWIAEGKGYKDPRWCTYKQAQDRGWQVRKDEKSCHVEYWAYWDRKEKKLLSWNDARVLITRDPDYANENLQLSCRTHSVFNAKQIDGIPELEQPGTNIGVLREHRDLLIRNMGIRYLEYGNEAYYTPHTDTVVLPPEASFDDPYSYMATFLHESGHATGHVTRLGRDLTGGFGSESYAREELRAEIAAAFTAQELGLQLTPEQLQKQAQRHAAYIQNWSSILAKSPDELFKAIKDADQISDYLLDKGEFLIDRVVASGQIGDVQYTVLADPEVDGLKLNFTGNGKVPETGSPEERPWQAFASQIRDVSFSANISGIGGGTLDGLKEMRHLSLPSGVPAVGITSEKFPKLQDVHFQSVLFHEYHAELHSPKNIAELVPLYPDMTREQLGQIELGYRLGLAAEQVAVYADARYGADQMSILRSCLQSGMAAEQMELLKDPSFSALQMDVLRSCIECGMTKEQVAGIARPEIPARKMLDLSLEIRSGGRPEERTAVECGYDSTWNCQSERLTNAESSNAFLDAMPEEELEC